MLASNSFLLALYNLPLLVALVHEQWSNALPHKVRKGNILSNRKIESLQVIRAIAALGVVLLHSAEATTKYSSFPARSLDLMKYGNYGVDLFFVLSGLVMCYTSGNQTASTFFRRRIERIAPTYWIITILAGVASMVFTVSEGRFTWGKLLVSMGFISLPTGNFPLVSQGWTLEYEMLFYGCVTAALFVTRRAWPLVVGILASAIIAGALIGPDSPMAGFLSAPIMLEFLMGILIAQWLTTNRVVSWEFVFVLVAVVVVYFSQTADHRPLYAGIPAAIIVLAAIYARSMTPPKWLVAIGNASYSIYLIQIFTIPGCAKVLHVVRPSFDPDMLALAATTVTVIAGFGFYSLVELKIQRWLRRSRSIPNSSAEGSSVLSR